MKTNTHTPTVLHDEPGSKRKPTRLMSCPNRCSCHYTDCRCHAKDHAYGHSCVFKDHGCPNCTKTDDTIKTCIVCGKVIQLGQYCDSLFCRRKRNATNAKKKYDEAKKCT